MRPERNTQCLSTSSQVLKSHEVLEPFTQHRLIYYRPDKEYLPLGAAGVSTVLTHEAFAKTSSHVLPEATPGFQVHRRSFLLTTGHTAPYKLL